MPDPTRTDMMDAVIDSILADADIAGTRVYRGRHNVTNGTQFPVVYVWLARDDINTQSLTRPRSRLHTISVIVDYWAKAATPGALEEAFDGAASEIEAACLNGTSHVHGAVTHYGIAGTAGEDIVLTGVEYLYEGDENEPFGCLRMSFALKYLTTEPN